ncbi:uncharacterized protein BJ171DRAFT_493745 [Polychytrium aggregatum]|uniref:uncharacterized protein n=1 Tax=Polychytrium aggregatum TaxID=110093 RepID=UPI0022FEC65C|nr:uncharacterized protein BJ171DRAFT_493745 [Polychytrium aggregatum]KAI9207129.1 hypothetical protein BJ171DRAFT_493745 [Polychytrium aggregatum]
MSLPAPARPCKPHFNESIRPCPLHLVCSPMLPLMQALSLVLVLLMQFLPVARALAGDCFALTSDNICGPEYAGFYINRAYPLPSVTNIPDTTANFSSYINTTFVNTSAVTEVFDSQKGCGPGVQVAIQFELRYQISFWCSWIVHDNIANDAFQCPPPSIPQNNPFLCAPQCALAASSLQQVLSDPSVCPSSSNETIVQARSSSISKFQTFCLLSANSSSPASCKQPVPMEAQFCGFRDAQALGVWCTSNPGDSCCTGPNSSSNPGQGPNATVGPGPGPGQGPTPSSANLAVVLGCSSVAIAVVAGVALYVHMRRRGRPSWPRSKIGARPTLRYSMRATVPSTIGPSNHSSLSRVSSAMALLRKPTFETVAEAELTPRSATPSETESEAQSEAPSETSGYSIPSVTTPGVETPIMSVDNFSISQSPFMTAAMERAWIPAKPRDSPRLYKVHQAYQSQMADELSLQAGQDVIVLAAYDDGWGLGLLPGTNKKGVFPLCFVGTPTAFESRAVPRTNSARSSSSGALPLARKGSGTGATRQ